MPLTEPDVQISSFRLFSNASLASGKHIKVVEDSRLWKRIPSKEAFVFLSGEASLLTPAVEPFEGHPFRSIIECLQFPHVPADAVVVVVSPELRLEHRPPVCQFGYVAD